MHIQRALAPAVVLLSLCLMASVPLLTAGCSAGQVRRQADKVSAEARGAVAAKQKLDAAIESLPNLPESEQVRAVRDALPPENRAAFDAAVARGQRAVDAAKTVSAAIGESAAQLIAQLDKLNRDLAQAQDSDDATLQLIAWGLGAAFPVLLPLVGLFSHRRGQTAGARFVASSVALGRKADDEFDKAFEGKAGGAMKAALNAKPGLAAAVRAVKTI